MPAKKNDDDESVLSLSEQTNRPADTALNQQRIPAWYPILDPVWVIISLFYLGIIMTPVGQYSSKLASREWESTLTCVVHVLIAFSFF
jgi:hypothetical protein